MQTAEHAHPFRDVGLLAWAVYALAGWRSLRCLREEDGSGRGVRAFGVAVGVAAGDRPVPARICRSRRDLGEGWRIAAFGLPWLLVATLVQWRPNLIATPLAESLRAMARAAAGVVR